VVHEASHTYIPSTLQGTGSTHIHVMCTQLQHYSTEHSSTSTCIVKSQLVKSKNINTTASTGSKRVYGTVKHEYSFCKSK